MNMVVIPVKWLESQGDKIVARVKQNNKSDIPITVDPDRLREQFSFLQHVQNPEQMVRVLKQRKESQEIHGNRIITRPLTFDLPNLKMGTNKRESRLERKKDYKRWNKC